MDLITFDLDQTLINANKCHWKAFNHAFEKHNLKTFHYNEFRKYLNGMHAHEIIKILFPKLNKKQIKKIAKEHSRFTKKYDAYSKKISGVIGALKKIKKKYLIGIVTNCHSIEIKHLMDGAGLDRKLFSVIVGSDDVKYSKPYPDELFKAEKLTHHNIAYHVGDSPYDIIAAKKAKAKSIAVLTGVHSRKVLLKEKPFKILKSIRDVPVVVL